MKRVRPIFISHNPYRSPKSKLQNKPADSAVNTATPQQISESQILIALGFIASLLLVGGMQLFRSVNASSSHIEPTSTEPTLTFNLEDSTSIAPSVELHFLTHSQRTEILTIQNAVSQGKF